MAKMVENETLGSGESALAVRRLYGFRVLAGCGALGAFIGALLAGANRNREAGFDFNDLSLHPGLSIALSAALLFGLVAVPAWMLHKIDEVKARRNLEAMAVGWFAILGGVPVWLVLTAGEWVSAPTAIGIFLLAYGATAVAFLVLKHRDKAGMQ